MSSGPSSPRAAAPPVVTPTLRRLLWVVFGLVALLGVNSAYLGSVTLLEWFSRRFGADLIYQNYFYLLMLLAHVALGLVLIVPFLAFGIPHLVAARRRANRRAVRIGYFLFGASLALLATGLLFTSAGTTTG